MKLLPVAALLASLLTTSLAFAEASPDAVYQGLGGKPGIQKLVAALVPGMLADPRIKEAFKDSDLKNLSMRLEQQFCALSGGPCKYEGKDMKEIHDGMNVTNFEFNALAEDLQIAMEQQGVASSIQNKLMAKLAPMQKTIVTK